MLDAENVGDASTAAGSTIKLTDSLPAGLRATGIAGSQPKPGGALGETVPLVCVLESLSCEAKSPLVSYDQIEVQITVEVLQGAKTGEQDTLTISGGGAASSSLSRPIRVGGDPSAFGIEDYELSVEGEGGAPVTQAGAHPFQATGTIMLDQAPDTAGLGNAPQADPASAARDISAELPAGMVANPGVGPRCLSWQFTTSVMGGVQDECPYGSAVGAASVTFKAPEGTGTMTLAVPVFNVEPEAGEPARFGFYVPIVDAPVILATSVRANTGEDWGVNLTASELPASAGLISATVTFWGVPGASAHDDARGWGCMDETRGRGAGAYESCVHVEQTEPQAFVTLPTACTGQQASSLLADPWNAPGEWQSYPSPPLPGLNGCEALQFTPTIATIPSTHSASSPSGLSFNLNFDTHGLTDGASLAQSDLQKTVVNLPEGMTIDPSAGVGLGACTPAQYAQATTTAPPSAGCPEDAKIGTVEIETPLLFTTVYGSLYIATPYDNPFSEPGHPDGSLIALYVIAHSRAERGILVKLAGKVTPNPTTGRLTVTFEDAPPLPFAHFNFHFKEGAQAPLISPPVCGTFSTTAQLYPYSNPQNALTDTSSFQVTSGSEGSPCPDGVPPFAPKIGAGTLTSHAGSFSPLYFDLSRTDAMQEIASFSASLPIGLTADLTGVPECPEADIAQARAKTGLGEEAQASCPEGSLIGHSLVGTGVGSVLDYVPGKLYLSGPFHGDPLSVVSITSAVVGPFDLGTIVIRFGLAIDPYTGQVSIDPTGSEPIPTIIDGIVTHVRDIRVSVDRPNFTINPTNCRPDPISSTMTSTLHDATNISTPLQATGCNELAFKPTFTASTKGKTGRREGASLTVKLTMPIKLGTQSNIRTVKVELPKQLPSRLETIQQACPQAQFEQNPAGCPKGSFIGHATATTPILPEPLSGPAIFVSHAGQEFPSIILVLQGYGFTIDLVGATFIDEKTGVISATFNAIPDEPVGNFKLTMPQGPYSALAANTNLCKLTHPKTVRKHITIRRHGHKTKVWKRIRRPAKHLRLKTLFIAQNGITLHRNTPITVTGCTKARHKQNHPHPHTKKHGKHSQRTTHRAHPGHS